MKRTWTLYKYDELILMWRSIWEFKEKIKQATGVRTNFSVIFNCINENDRIQQLKTSEFTVRLELRIREMH